MRRVPRPPLSLLPRTITAAGIWPRALNIHVIILITPPRHPLHPPPPPRPPKNVHTRWCRSINKHFIFLELIFSERFHTSAVLVFFFPLQLWREKPSKTHGSPEAVCSRPAATKRSRSVAPALQHSRFASLICLLGILHVLTK